MTRFLKSVPENHLKYSFSDDYQGYVLTIVKINNVTEFKSVDTYNGSQRERGWDDIGNGQKMKLYSLNEKGVGIGCSLNDKLIVGKFGEIPEPKFAIKNFVDSKGFLPNSYKIELETILRKKLEETI